MPGRRVISLATISFLFVGLLFTSTSALAYWRDVTVSKDVEVVTIGEPVQLLVSDITGDSSLRLVPEGYALTVGDVEEITLQYEIGVSRELLNTVDLHITVSDILINESDEYSHLVDIDILDFDDQATLDLYNDQITITVTIRLIEPIDEDEAVELGLDLERVNVEDSIAAFEAIKGQNVTFVLNFQIQQKQTTANN